MILLSETPGLQLFFERKGIFIDGRLTIGLNEIMPALCARQINQKIAFGYNLDFMQPGQ